MQIKNWIAICSLMLFPFVALADDQNDSNIGTKAFSFLKSIYSPKPANLTKLIDAKKLKEADTYLASERKYFFDNKKEQTPLLLRLATELNNVYDPQFITLGENISKMSDYTQGNWGEIKSTIGKANNLISEYNSFEIFKDEQVRSKELLTVQDNLTKLQVNLKKAALTSFQQVDQLSNVNFFDVYPVEVNANYFFNENKDTFRTIINTLNTSQVVNFKAKYSSIISDVEFNDLLSSRYVKTTLASEKSPYSVGKILSILKKAREAGLNPKLADVKISFIETTGKNILIGFPVQVEMDLPFEQTKSELENVLENTGVASADYIIIYDVSTASVARNIVGKNEIVSKYVTGTTSEPNPAYEIAREKLFEARRGLEHANNLDAPTVGSAIVKGIAVASWAKNKADAEANLMQTPTTLYIDVFESYRYSTSDVQTTRAMKTEYYVIDKRAKRYYKGAFDNSENRVFKFSYNIHDKDPDRGEIINAFNKEADIASFEKSPMSVKVSALMDDYLNNENQSKPLISIAKLQHEMLKDKIKLIADSQSKQVDRKTLAANTVSTNTASANNTTSSNSSATDKLRELQGLKKEGLISEKEFQSKKKQLLDNL